MPLGKTLKALRQKQSLNQKALSTLSGVSQATISRIETGRVRQLRSSALKHLADALGVSVDFLMGDNEVFASIPAAGVEPASTIPGVREDRFRQIADALNAFVVHEQGRILYVNQTFADAVGYRKEELLGKNGIELVSAPRSRSACQRLVTTVSSESYELLLVRKDGSMFPAEFTGSSINENTRLAVMRDNTEKRCQQTVARVQAAGLETDRLEDMVRVVRVMADELEDMGLAFEGVGINVIDETRDRLLVYMTYPESRSYRSFQDQYALKDALEQYPTLRSLQSHWRRQKVWEREVDEDYRRLIEASSMEDTYHPDLLLDIPFPQGTLSMGIAAEQTIRVEDTVTLLRNVSQPISFILKRLMDIEVLAAKVRSLQGQGANQQPVHIDRSIGDC